VFEPTLLSAIRQVVGTFIPQIGNLIKFPPKNVSDFFLRAVKETVDYREKNNVKRNDFMQLLIELRNKAELLDDYENTELTGTQNGSVKINNTQNGTSKDSDDLETLRKYPPLPNHFRRCTVPYTIPGTKVRLEKGTRVFIPILGLQMDPAYFPDPHKFDPERFSEENKATRPRFAYLPFGEGPRNCIGMRFGQLQTKLGLAVLLHSYRFTPCDQTLRQVRFEPKAFFTASRGGNWLRLTARH
ncbi:Probable cytochrome P450 28c1, partial [Gryllus bimaculatus]